MDWDVVSTMVNQKVSIVSDRLAFYRSWTHACADLAHPCPSDRYPAHCQGPVWILALGVTICMICVKGLWLVNSLNGDSMELKTWEKWCVGGRVRMYKARHAHKRLYTVLPKYSKIQVLPGITSCRLMKYNTQAIELNSLLMNNMPKDGYGWN